MEKTDRQTDKSTRWAFTAYEDQWCLFKDIKQYDIVKEWGWQQETCPTSGRLHYQGYLLLSRQARFSQLVKTFPGVHIEPARNWQALVQYCKKKDTATAGTQVHQINEREFLNMHSAFVLIGRELIEYAELYESDLFEYTKSQTIKHKDPDVYEYKWATRRLVDKSPQDVAVYSNPQFQRAWTDYGRTFKRLARKDIQAELDSVASLDAAMVDESDSITDSSQDELNEVQNEFISPA